MYLLGIYTENTVPLLIQTTHTAPNLKQDNIFIIFTYTFIFKLDCKNIDLILNYFLNALAVYA